MKLELHYEPGDHIAFTFDEDVRKVFKSVAELAREFSSDPHVRRSAANSGGEVTRAWQSGLDALDRLAYVPSATIHISPIEATLALNLLSVAAHFQVDRQGDLTDLTNALLLLGQGRPCRIGCGDLPRSQDVWPGKAVPPNIKSLYERIRSEDGEIELPILQAVWLYHALKDAVVGSGIDMLRNQLSLGTTPYRQALKRVLEANYRESRRQRKNNRKPKT